MYIYMFIVCPQLGWRPLFKVQVSDHCYTPVPSTVLMHCREHVFSRYLWNEQTWIFAKCRFYLVLMWRKCLKMSCVVRCLSWCLGDTGQVGRIGSTIWGNGKSNSKLPNLKNDETIISLWEWGNKAMKRSEERLLGA